VPLLPIPSISRNSIARKSSRPWQIWAFPASTAAGFSVDLGAGVADFSRMTDLSQSLRTRLEEGCRIASPAIETRQVSSDGTMKLLLRLEDGRHIEACTSLTHRHRRFVCRPRLAAR
jgi:hypothetical protein